MANTRLRFIRPIANAAEGEYLKEFFSFIGCTILDYAIDVSLHDNWERYLKPERESQSFDVVFNYFGNDPYAQECMQKGGRRVYCYFDFSLKTGVVTTVPQQHIDSVVMTNAHARHNVLKELIAAVWSNAPETVQDIQRIASIYQNTSKGDLFFYLQAKRCLRVLTMGEVLKEPSAHVTYIPLSDYIKRVLAALGDVYVQLKSNTGLYSVYSRINSASMIIDISQKLREADLLSLASIMQGGEIVFPIDELIRELQNLIEIDPSFLSAYLLMADLYRLSKKADENEILCYQKMVHTVGQNSKEYSSLWYRIAYFSEKKLADMDKALECYKKAARFDPSNYQALFKLGYYAASDGRYCEAESLLNQTILVIFCGKSTEPDEDGVYKNWLTLSLKECQYVFKVYMLLAKVAINKKQEYAAQVYIARACMAATRFDEAALIQSVADGPEFEQFIEYHQHSTPVWAIWQVLSPWSEDIIQDFFILNIVRQHLERWAQ